MGAVNTPVFRASTIVFPTAADFNAAIAGDFDGLAYGLHGLPQVPAPAPPIASPRRGPPPRPVPGPTRPRSRCHAAASSESDPTSRSPLRIDHPVAHTGGGE